MHVERISEATPSALAEAAARAAQDPDTRGLLVFLAIEEGWDPQEWDPMLDEIALPIVGGAFPWVFAGADVIDSGGIVVSLPYPLCSAVLRDMSRGGTHVTDQLETAFADVPSDGRTIVTLFDATATNVDELLGTLFDRFGLFGHYLGGGAGSLDFERRPCLFTEEGLVQDAAIVAIIDVPSQLGVAHGWEPISEPMHVTASEGNHLAELDDQPATEVYRKLVEAHGGREFDPDDFFELARSYPFGIVQLDGEMLVRDPLWLDAEGRIVCAGEVPTGAFLRLLHGDETSLLQAADSAAVAAGCAAGASAEDGTDIAIVFDCVSRVLYLGDRFYEELGRISQGLALVGAATIGEVCNPGDRYLELFNKTIVVARMGAGPPAADG